MAKAGWPVAYLANEFEEDFKDWLTDGVASSVIYTVTILAIVFLLIRFLR